MVSRELQQTRSELLQATADLVSRELELVDPRINNGTGMLFLAMPSFQDFEHDHTDELVERLIVKLGPPDAVELWKNPPSIVLPDSFWTEQKIPPEAMLGE